MKYTKKQKILILTFLFSITSNLNCTSELKHSKQYNFEVHGPSSDMVTYAELSSSEIEQIIDSVKQQIADFRMIKWRTGTPSDDEGDEEDPFSMKCAECRLKEFGTIKDQLEPILFKLTHESDGITRLNPFILDRILPAESKSKGIAQIGITEEKDGLMRVLVNEINVMDHEDTHESPVFGVFADCIVDNRVDPAHVNKYSTIALLEPIELAYQLSFLRSSHKDYLDSGKIYKKIYQRKRLGPDWAVYFGHARSIEILGIPNILPQLANLYELISFIGLHWYKSDRMSDLIVPCYGIQICDLGHKIIAEDYKTDPRYTNHI